MTDNNNKTTTTTTDNNGISIGISSSHRSPCGLDWAESSWKRWIYVAFWWWLNPILNIGYKRKLTEDDLFDLSPNDECGRSLKKLETVWEKYENNYEYINTWKIIAKAFWKDALIINLILFPYLGLKISQPLFIREIVVNINDSNAASYVGYLYSIGLGFSTIFLVLIHHQIFFRATRLGIQIRIGLSSIIYKRLLSLPTRSIMKTTTTGHLVNLISNDVSKFEELCKYIHHIWAAPLEALIVFGIIWNQIGIPTLFGYTILLLQVPLQWFFSKKFGTYRKNTMQWTDERIKMINEILVGCQIVKMYRWEEALETIVHHTRKKEFKSIKKANRIRAINMAIYFSSLSLVSLATFGGSWLMGQKLSSENVFTVLSFFGLMRLPIATGIPDVIERLSESKIASQRINQFMNLSKQTRAKTLQEHSNNDHKCIPGSIVMDRASFTWDSTQSAQLIKINLNLNSGSLVGIVGTTGSCKSSLLAAILGEMYLIEGNSKINGKIVYVSQIPWIFSGTIRENILFSKCFDKEKYERVLKSCCLITDLQSFSAGDLTIIGEKGINLSGGQKVRVSLARALYTEADIYLFDDPLAAVDSTVARKIFQQCISNQGILNDKTRLLVTHQIQFLPEFDHCILLNDGKIEKQGLFDDLLTIEKIKQSYENQEKHTNNTEEINNKRNDHDDSTKIYENIDKNSIVIEETSVDGTVHGYVWFKLFTSSYGWTGLILLILFMLLGQGLHDATNKWLSLWSSKSEEEQQENAYPYVYLGLVIGTWIISIIRADYFFHLILRGASVFHNNMFKGVLYSSLRFYESNPVGRILNRFSKDQQVLDELLPLTFFDAIQSLILVLGSIVIIGMANPWVLFILIIIIPTFIWLRRIYVKTSTEIKRLDSISRSPIYALFSSSLSGLMTIRAFKVEDHFLNSFIDKVNGNTRALFMFICSTRWFGLRLDLMACCLTFLTAILSVTLRKNMDASSVALGLTYSISLSDLFQWGVRQSAETENYMVSAERIDEYSHIPPEPGFYKAESEPPANWPVEGRIQFDGYKLSYRSGLEPVLKGINLIIEPHNKIGIIGRTGAGKSSIFQALFRLIDKSTTDGKILIDGIDINTISLNDLRSILNIIPQSPVLFSNTLRYNLDPFSHYTDEQLWDALEAVQLKTKINNLKDKLNIQIAEYGSNFSVGECQLMCVARAILKQSKILLIDEATAHVDTKTDELIQQILREKFTNQTILTIAHRLNTVMDSDKIVIMNDGIIAEYETPRELFTEKNELLTNINSDDKSVLYL
jgi:ATP-binding cassette subfamily C (CFTR/MRP) protein 4